MSMLENRLRKNFRHRKKWARRQGITCYRVYDHDIPEFPLSVDYLDGFVALRFGKRFEPDLGLAQSVGAGLDIDSSKVTWSGSVQHSCQIQEEGHSFALEMGRAFDYGLFLDHRNLRKRVQSESQGRRFLNLFCYTASFSVYAAAGGAISSLSVDLSKANLAWAQRNYELNGLGSDHGLLQADVMAFLGDCSETFDIIVCDPPTFSNSKRAAQDFDVQRVHPELLTGCLSLLAPGGTLYFSNNARKFRMDGRFSHAQEITSETIPEDFKRRPNHRCWQLDKL